MLAVTALSFVRIPSLKISVIILSLFFLYDIFWVFLSEYVFKKNVMVSVATELPSLPMLIVMPRLLDDGASLLGLGDIVLPGIFLCFLYRFDKAQNTPFKKGYFLRAWIGYFLGFLLTLVMVYALQRGQPALLYLVPATILPTIGFSYSRGELRILWRGYKEVPESTALNARELESGVEERDTLLQSVDVTPENEKVV